MSRLANPVTRLERALLTMARDAGLAVAVEDVRAVPWASALFVGEQIWLSLRGPDTGAFGEWLRVLPEIDFGLRGHLVADFTIISGNAAAGERRCAVLALVIEDGIQALLA